MEEIRLYDLPPASYDAIGDVMFIAVNSVFELGKANGLGFAINTLQTGIENTTDTINYLNNDADNTFEERSKRANSGFATPN